MMTTQLSIDGLRYQVDHLFVALAAEATALGPLRVGGTLQVGLGF